MANSDCIYACGSDSASTQEYHLYPASASTIEILVPTGLVCNKCNGYFSELEGYFTHYHPGSSMRLWSGVTTRKGKTPKFTHENGEMTRVDDSEGHHVSTPLGDMRIERHPNGDFTIVGNFTPRPFDASMISRLLHKCAFETLAGIMDDPTVNPRADRFVPLRDYVRRPRSATEFQPFAWKRHVGKQEPPMFVTIRDQHTNEWIADVCQLVFPGVVYFVAYPRWPVATRAWQGMQELGFKIVDAPGTTVLEPEEIRIPLHQMPRPDSPSAPD